MARFVSHTSASQNVDGAGTSGGKPSQNIIFSHKYYYYKRYKTGNLTPSVTSPVKFLGT